MSFNRCILAFPLVVLSASAISRGRRKVVLAIGDSVTQGVPFVQPGNTYPELLAAMAGEEVVNLGIGGMTVAEMAMELGSHLDEHRPGTVVVSGGGNDIDYGRSADDVIHDLEDISCRVDRAGARLVLCTLTPSSLADADEAARSQVNEWIRTNGSGLWSLADIDVRLRDSLRPSRLSPEFDSGDGVHPNAEGMREIAGAIAGLLQCN